MNLELVAVVAGADNDLDDVAGESEAVSVRIFHLSHCLLTCASWKLVMCSPCYAMEVMVGGREETLFLSAAES